MWTFEYKTGTMWAPDGSEFGKCYAGGDLGKVPQAVDNPEFEAVRNTGPLPEGIYTFGGIARNTKLGPTAIPLIPDPGNDMKGRSGFYIHWDTHVSGNASEGCVVMLDGELIEKMWASEDHQLKVVAQRIDVFMPDDSF